MVWIVTLVIVAVAGVVALVIYALGLRHRYQSVMHELQIAAERTGEATSLLRSVDIRSMRRK